MASAPAMAGDVCEQDGDGATPPSAAQPDSLACGNGAVASGEGSTAIGSGSAASEVGASAFGEGADASGAYASALGSESRDRKSVVREKGCPYELSRVVAG